MIGPFTKVTGMKPAVTTFLPLKPITQTAKTGAWSQSLATSGEIDNTRKFVVRHASVREQHQRKYLNERIDLQITQPRTAQGALIGQFEFKFLDGAILTIRKKVGSSVAYGSGWCLWFQLHVQPARWLVLLCIAYYTVTISCVSLFPVSSLVLYQAPTFNYKVISNIIQ